MTPIDARGFAEAKSSAAAELVERLRDWQNILVNNYPGDLIGSAATLIEQQSAHLQELEALIERIPRCKACGKPWPEYGITTLPHGCIDAARAAGAAGVTA
jgi:hypothetical protein